MNTPSPPREARSLLHRMTLETPTQFWNDSCEVVSLARAIEHGATGATSNPVIVMAAIDADRPRWVRHTRDIIADFQDASEIRIAQKLAEDAARAGAALLLPVFEAHRGKRGRLSMQVSPRSYRNSAAMVEEGITISRLAPNMAVKIPAVAAGLAAIEELTSRGVVTNATVSYSVAQAVAVAEAVERGLAKAAPGVDTQRVTPWVTIMVGRIDDHLRDEAAAHGIAIDPEHVRQASTAIFRKAYRLFRERGYRSTLLAAAMRSHHHWSELIGGDVVITIPPNWQEKFEASGVEVKNRIDDEVPPAIVDELLTAFPDFRRAYDSEGMAPQEFVFFGPSRKTLRQFLGGLAELESFVREQMLPV